MMQEAAQRMPPVDGMMIAWLRALPVLLDDFVGKQENHQNERNHQKRAQYYVFDHDNLLVVKRLPTYCSPHATDCTVGEHLLTSISVTRIRMRADAPLTKHRTFPR